MEQATVLRALDPDDERYPYLKIADRVREAIAEGRWQQGKQLPSVWAIARRYGVAAETAHRAVGVLETEGVVRCVKGRGTFIRTWHNPT